MLTVCAGRSRSGSTLLYNIVRIILSEFYDKDNVYSRGLNFYKKNHQRKYNIVKLHDSSDNYFYKNADYIFSCRRNEKDQRESIRRFRKISKSQNMTSKQLDDFITYDLKRYKKWSTHKNFVKTFEYDLLVNDKEGVVKDIYKAFKFKISRDRINNILNKIEKLKLPTKEAVRDTETALTWHHITGGDK